VNESQALCALYAFSYKKISFNQPVTVSRPTLSHQNSENLKRCYYFGSTSP